MDNRILWDIIDGLRDEIRQRKAELDKAENGRQEMYNDMDAEVKQLQADNNSFHGQFDEIQELKADKMKHILGYDTLQAEYNSLKADNVRLVEQVGSNSHSNSSTHTHTISKEIAEYMENNEGCECARLFLIPIEEFNDGEYDNIIYWEDGIE